MSIVKLKFIKNYEYFNVFCLNYVYNFYVGGGNYGKSKL
jgi:hypothetical protein